MYAGLELGCQGACPLGLLGTHSAGLGAGRKEASPSGAQGPGALERFASCWHPSRVVPPLPTSYWLPSGAGGLTTSPPHPRCTAAQPGIPCVVTHSVSSWSVSMDDRLLGEDQDTERARVTCSRPAHREQSGGCPRHLPLPQAAVTRTPSRGPGRHPPGGPAYPKAAVGLSLHGAQGRANHSLGPNVAQRTVLVNSILLELKHAHFFSADVLSLGVTTEIMWASESKILTFWPLQKKTADTRYGKS